MSWQFEVAVPSVGRMTEGPVWDGTGVLFSHIHGNRIMRYDPVSRKCHEAYSDTHRTNGLMMDSKGRLFGAMAGKHGVAQFHPDGSHTVLANELDGKSLNRPADLAVDRLGRIWFTDPFGREFPPSPAQPDHQSVMRLDPQADGSYTLRRMTFDTFSPNGILMSKDERTLYISQGGYRAPVRELRAYPLQHDDRLGHYRTLLTLGRDGGNELHREAVAATRPEFVEGWGLESVGTHRGVDGMTLDVDGNIFATAGWREAGPGPMIYVLSPEGRILETHPVPFDMPTNCTFGDADLSSLYVTTAGGLLLRVQNTGYRGYLPYLNYHGESAFFGSL